MAFRELGWTRTISEIADWVHKEYGAKWKDIGTTMANMVPDSHGEIVLLQFQSIFECLKGLEKVSIA